MLDIAPSSAPPLMPLPILAAVTVLSFAIWAYSLRHQRQAVTIFMVTAIGLRYVVSAYHFVTFDPIAFGLSINALFSILVVAIGLLLVDIRLLLLKVLLPVYLLIFVILVSGLLNAEIKGALDITIKLAYFVILTLALIASFIKTGEQKSCQLLLLAFFPPIALQLLSIILGLGKATETDGSVSFIGGYNHEAAFSILLMTFTTLITLISIGSGWRKNGLFSLGVIGIVLANYRTTLLAVLPIIVNRLLSGSTQIFMPRQRLVVLMWAIPVMGGLLFLAGLHFQDRFAEIATALDRGATIFGDPTSFTELDKKILSGRLYLWSRYVAGYLNGNDVQIILGHGPGSWSSAFSTYAHNTAVSTLYELGPIGVSAMLLMWATFFFKSFRCLDGPKRRTLLAAHTGFIILNQATMPHWLIEGDILYAIICAATIHATFGHAQPVLATQWQQSRSGFHPT